MRDEQGFNFLPQSAAARLLYADEVLHISSQVMSKVNPLDHQEDQPIFQYTIFSFMDFHIEKRYFEWYIC